MKRITVENVFIASSILVDSQNKKQNQQKNKKTKKPNQPLNNQIYLM